MTIRNLDALFRPRSVALIGASDRAGSIGAMVLRNLQAAGFKGPVHPVNPKHKALQGLTAYPSLDALPEAPDLVVIATPAPTVPAAIAQAAARGSKGAVVISAGVNGDLRQAMLAAARPQLLRIAGPNCLGIMVPPLGLNASFSHLQPAAGGIALVAQSGAIIASIIDWAAPRGIGFSHLASLGDMADVDFGDMLDYLAADGAVTAILLYMEQVTQARKFMSAARLAARAKPVIVIKPGRHAETARAVASHTGALAGTDLVYDAAFRRAGMLRVLELEELFDAAETVAKCRAPRGDRLAILTNGGGIGILATDALIDRKGHLADLSPETLAQLDAVLPAAWSHGNPVDIVGDADDARYAAALEALLKEPGADGILVLNCPTALAAGAKSAAAIAERAAAAALPVLTSWVGGAAAAEAQRLFAARGVPTFDTPEDAVRAFMQLVEYRRSQEQLMETPAALSGEAPEEPEKAAAILRQAMGEGREMLTGPEAMAVIGAFGIPVNPIWIATGAEEAAALAAKIGGPVALKILSPEISHKSDVGGVMLDLAGEAAVGAAAEAMLARVRAVKPSARVTGLTIEAMVRRPQAYELILGLIDDRQFGPVVLFGQGGVATELLADRAVALPPLNLNLARELMTRTKIHRLLRGFRDRPPAALDAIAAALMRISNLAAALPEVVELDINPLLADAAGVIALDARIRLRKPEKPGTARFAIRPYPLELEETVAIAGGRALRLRPVRPEDEPAFLRGFAKLSPQTVRLRFFAPLKEMSHALAARLTQIDYEREMALLLSDPQPGGDIYGVVRLMADPDNTRAEFAVVVRDDMTGQGLGTLLIQKIIAYARNRGLGEIFGDVLAENEAMLDLCRRLGFDIDAVAADGVLRVRLELLGGAESD
jgi:acetyltransferase